MKKVFLTSVVLLMAVMAQAQTKISAKLVNGFKAVYTEESTIDVGGSAVKVVEENEYAVSNVTAQGAMITVTTTKVSTDGDENPMAGILTAGAQIMEGVPVKFNTDADGKVTGVANLDEVKAQMAKASKAIIDKIFEASPELAAAVPRESLESQFAENMNEEALMTSVAGNGVLALNGKTIANGATESDKSEEGLKMKRMYFVTGKSIIANSTLDMTTEELKDFIIKKIEEEAPEQAEMVKENIGMLMEQMKPEVTSKSTYVMQDNGWPKSVKTETTQNMMGQSQKQTTVVTLK